MPSNAANQIYLFASKFKQKTTKQRTVLEGSQVHYKSTASAVIFHAKF
jgi:hypothetical protein